VKVVIIFLFLLNTFCVHRFQSDSAWLLIFTQNKEPSEAERKYFIHTQDWHRFDTIILKIWQPLHTHYKYKPFVFTTRTQGWQVTPPHGLEPSNIIDATQLLIIWCWPSTIHSHPGLVQVCEGCHSHLLSPTNLLCLKWSPKTEGWYVPLRVWSLTRSEHSLLYKWHPTDTGTQPSIHTNILS